MSVLISVFVAISVAVAVDVNAVVALDVDAFVAVRVTARNTFLLLKVISIDALFCCCFSCYCFL